MGKKDKCASEQLKKKLAPISSFHFSKKGRISRAIITQFIFVRLQLGSYSITLNHFRLWEAFTPSKSVQKMGFHCIIHVPRSPPMKNGQCTMRPKVDSGHRFFCCFVLVWFVCLFVFLAKGDISRTHEPRVLLMHYIKANRPFRVPLAYIASLSRQLRRLVKLSILKRGKVPNISCENEFYLHETKKSFSRWLRT